MINLSQFYPTSINQNNFVYTTGNQRISGIKDFDQRPTVNGVGVVLYGEFCPEDLVGGSGVNPENVVFTTGDQLIFGEKLFRSIYNAQGAPLLASGEGKYLEKYFNLELNSGQTGYNISYWNQRYPNSVIFVTVKDIGTYDIYLPSTTLSNNADYIKFVFDQDPVSNYVYSSGESNAENYFYISGCPGTPPYTNEFVSGTGDCFDCISNCNQEVSGFFDSDGYNITGLTINFYGSIFDYTGDHSYDFLKSVSPNVKDNIAFAFRDGRWYIESEKNDIIPPHSHSIDDIEGIEEYIAASGDFIHLEKVFNHTFIDGLNILYTAPYERNSYVNLTFNTTSPCYVDLPTPTGNVLNGDRILFNVRTKIQESERIVFRHNPFDGNGNYLPYVNIVNLPYPSVGDFIEFWYQEPEWKIKLFNINGSGSFGGGGGIGGGGSGCCSTIEFPGNRTIRTTSWPTNLNPGATDVVTFLNRIFYPFQSATISLSPYNLKELGTTFSNITYQTNLIQNDENSNGLTNLRLLNGNTLVSGISNPTFGSFNYLTNLSLTNTSTLSARVTVNNEGSPIDIVASQVVNFEAPMYFGAGGAGLEEAAIKSTLTKQVELKSDKSRDFNANNQKLYFVVPISWGLLTSIRDGYNLENINGWSSRIREFTLADGVTKQNYYIWETNTLVFDVSNFNIIFRF